MRIQDFNALCKQTIVWEPIAGRDAYGKPQYGTPQTFRGRRVFKMSRHASKGQRTIGQGVDTVTESQIWILATPNVGYEDRVYVQGDTIFPPILSFQKYPDETGKDVFVKVLMGSANG